MKRKRQKNRRGRSLWRGTTFKKKTESREMARRVQQAGHEHAVIQSDIIERRAAEFRRNKAVREAERAVYEKLIEEARRSGKAVYEPFGPLEDET